MRKVPNLKTMERTASAKHTRGEGPPNFFVFAFVSFGTNRTPQGTKKRQSAFIATGNGEFWKAGNNNHPSPSKNFPVHSSSKTCISVFVV